MKPKSRDFHEISSFLESRREASKQLQGCLVSVLECLCAAMHDFVIEKGREYIAKVEVFSCISWCSYGVLRRRRCLSWARCVAAESICAGLHARGPGSVSVREICGGKGLRVIPRGKQRLTVYRAHQVCVFVWHGTNFCTFLRSRAIQECICCVCLCVLEKVVREKIFFCDTEKVEIFMKIWLFSKMPKKHPWSF